MNLKVSFVNFKYLLENTKKSKGIIFLFILIIPLFTYLFMLLSSSYSERVYFPKLLELSAPTIFGMYIIPFVLAVTLFSFVFKKDSVDFINALPLKRSVIYITNIVGGILLFLLIFGTTSLFMWIMSNFFDNLVIPKMMYFHYFITFFIAYIYVFIASSLTLSLTGSRIVHVALTLIILFLPGFMGDFYTSLAHDNSNYNYYAYSDCSNYDVNCNEYQISNEFNIKKSYKLDNNQTLPYKYINAIPRAVLGTYNVEVNYNNEITSVYNLPSIIKMLMLSIIYFVLGLYAFYKRKMEIAETTFKSENIHQLVKCITLLPLSLAVIATFARGASSIALLIFVAIIVIMYIVYDLITRRNNTRFMKSVIYLLSFALASILIYVSFNAIASIESSKKITREDVSNIGIKPNTSFDYYNNSDFNALNFKIYDNEIIDLIFNNAYKTIKVDSLNRYFAIRLTLKNGLTYYFNMRLSKEEYDKLLKLLDSKKDYADNFKHIDYDKIYGVQIGSNYYPKNEAVKLIDLVRESYNEKSISNISNQAYIDYNYYGDDSTSVILYIYASGVKSYRISSDINPALADYIMKMQNEDYILNVKNKNVNSNSAIISTSFNSNDLDSQFYYEYLNVTNDEELLYRYINNNIKSNIDFSKYSKGEIAAFSVLISGKTRFNGSNAKFYRVFLVKDEEYRSLIDHMKDVVDKNKKSTDIKDKI